MILAAGLVVTEDQGGGRQADLPQAGLDRCGDMQVKVSVVSTDVLTCP
jgi:hypothetical protein